MEQEINACLPTAIAFKQGLRDSDVWARVLIYRYYSPEYKRVRGHAIVAYLYPPRLQPVVDLRPDGQLSD